MLRIRHEQIDAFQLVADEYFVRRVSRYVRDNHADVLIQLSEFSVSVENIADESLFELIRHGIARARSYGINLESDLTANVVMMFVAAPNFDEHPLIQRVLKSQEIQPDLRMNELWERVSEQTWEAVKKNYNPKAWRMDEGEVGQ